MNLKTSSTSLLIILLAMQLTSCAIASPTPNIIILTPTSQPTLTSTPEPSATPPPQPTETNTAIPTPEKLTIPSVSFPDFRAFTDESYIPVDHDTLLQIISAIEDGMDSVLRADIENIDPVSLGTNQSINGRNVILICQPMVNCAPRYAVQENGMNKIIWEMIMQGKDGIKKRVAFTMVSAAKFNTPEYQQYAWDAVHALAGAVAQVELVVVIENGYSNMTAVVTDLVSPNEVRDKLFNKDIPDEIGETPFWVTKAETR